MTDKKDQWVYMLKNGSKKAKRIKLDKFVTAVNHNCFTKKFFINEKDVKKHIKEERELYGKKIIKTKVKEVSCAKRI